MKFKRLSKIDFRELKFPLSAYMMQFFVEYWAWRRQITGRRQLKIERRDDD